MRPRPLIHPGPLEPFDERDTVFARTRLRAGTELYDEYYARRPELKQADDRTRAQGNLASPGSRRYRPGPGALAEATFTASDLIAAAVDETDDDPTAFDTPFGLGATRSGGTAGPRHAASFASPTALGSWIKDTALFLGAADVGLAPLDPAFVYTHRGRPTARFGEQISLDHRFAAVLVFPMRHGLVQSSPEMTATVETGRVYQQLSAACFILADALNRMGIPARAHVDSSYLVLCPPLGVEAGLGELGRNGILIHPTFGPGVRLGAVTLDAEVAVDEQICHGIVDFCRVCGKCATNCPAGAIPEGEPSVLHGALKWPMNAERCYHYWRAQGTDCGLCIRTCPFAKKDTSLHQLVRQTIARSTAFNRFFLWCDDRVYGASPPAKPPTHLGEGPTEARQ
jgi:ferredoxin